MQKLTPDKVHTVTYCASEFDLERQYVTLQQLGRVIETCLEVGRDFGRNGEFQDGSDGQYGVWRAYMRKLLDMPCHHVFNEADEPECITCGEVILK